MPRPKQIKNAGSTSMSNATNIIFGCSGPRLTPDEKALFRHILPWGFILFARNIDTGDQVKALVDDFRVATGRDQVIVLIDQEGGRVSRLPEPEWRIPPAPPTLARLYTDNPQLAEQAFRLNYQLIGHELKEIGINVNCAPMLDIPTDGASSVVTDRALGDTPEQVTRLGSAVCEGLKAAGVAPVIKHGPGHGRALVDSHHLLPRVDASLEALRETDFLPFKSLRDETMLMTAHIIFEAIDTARPGTLSPEVINTVLRGEIGFDGLIMSDDLNMHALTGSMQERTAACLSAGCDIALQCSGDMDDMKDAAAAVSPLEGKALLRTQNAEQEAFAPAADFDVAAAYKALADLLPK